MALTTHWNSSGSSLLEIVELFIWAGLIWLIDLKVPIGKGVLIFELMGTVSYVVSVVAFFKVYSGTGREG